MQVSLVQHFVRWQQQRTKAAWYIALSRGVQNAGIRFLRAMSCIDCSQNSGYLGILYNLLSSIPLVGNPKKFQAIRLLCGRPGLQPETKTQTRLPHPTHPVIASLIDQAIARLFVFLVIWHAITGRGRFEGRMLGSR